MRSGRRAKVLGTKASSGKLDVLVEPLLAKAGVLTERAPTDEERKISTTDGPGRHLRTTTSASLVGAETACVRVEAWRVPTPPSTRGQLMAPWKATPPPEPAPCTFVKIAKRTRTWLRRPGDRPENVELKRSAGATAWR